MDGLLSEASAVERSADWCYTLVLGYGLPVGPIRPGTVGGQNPVPGRLTKRSGRGHNPIRTVFRLAISLIPGFILAWQALRHELVPLLSDS